MVLSFSQRTNAEPYRRTDVRNGRPVPRLHPNLADVYRAKVEALHEALAEAQERDQALGLLRNFIDRIEMKPVDGGFEIELTGNIAHMVEASLAGPGSKKAALDERTACSVKVVAGARNQRYLQLAEGWIPRFR